MGLSALVEGVETRQQHRLDRQMLCDFAQRDFYHRPMPAEQIEKLLT